MTLKKPKTQLSRGLVRTINARGRDRHGIIDNAMADLDKLYRDFEKLYVGLAETMRHPYIFPPVFPLFLFEMNDQLHISKSVFQKMAIWVY